VFCACGVIQLFSVVFCVLRAVHKFDFRPVINETPNNWRPMERGSCTDTDSYFLHFCMFSHDYCGEY
jgi:hypothetical protein